MHLVILNRIGQIIVILMVATPFFSAGAQELTLKQICEITHCRENQTIIIASTDGRLIEVDISGLPVVLDGTVNIYPSEKLAVEVTVTDEEISDLTFVENASNPDRTITIEFYQDKKLGDGYGMMLIVNNPFDRYLRYEAFIENVEKQEFEYTSSCPVGPGLTSYEIWPYPIIHLALTKFRLLPKDATEGEVSLACE